MGGNFNNISLVQISDLVDPRRILMLQITLMVHYAFTGIDWSWRMYERPKTSLNTEGSGLG